MSHIPISSVPIPESEGGTDLSVLPAASSLLGVKTDGTGYHGYSLEAGSNVTILYSGSTITLSAAATGGSGTGDMVLADAQTVTGAKTFNDTTLLLKESGGSDTITLSASTQTGSATLAIPNQNGSQDEILTKRANQRITGTKVFEQGTLVLKEQGALNQETVSLVTDSQTMNTFLHVPTLTTTNDTILTTGTVQTSTNGISLNTNRRIMYNQPQNISGTTNPRATVGVRIDVLTGAIQSSTFITTGPYIGTYYNAWQTAAADNSVASLISPDLVTSFVAKPIGTFFTGMNSTSNIRTWAGFTNNGLVTGHDTPGASAGYHGAAFRYSTSASDSTWKLVTSNGSADTVVDTGVSPDTTMHKFTISMIEGSGTIYGYIDDVLVATSTLTLPGSSTGLGYVMSVTVRGAAVAKQVYGGRWYIETY